MRRLTKNSGWPMFGYRIRLVLCYYSVYLFTSFLLCTNLPSAQAQTIPPATAMPVPIVVDSVSQSTASPTATPQPTATAALPPAIFISEFLADPQAVGDDLGEWIELYNAGDTIINLRNWQLLDLDNDQHVIAIDLVIAPGQYLVLARNTDTAINGGVAAAYQYNNLALANSNDELLLVTPDGAEADRVRWGEGTALTTKAGASLQRLLQDNNQVWIESSAVWSGSSGDTGTPGQPYTPEIATPMQPTPTAITPNTTPIPATATPPSATWPQAATGSPLIIDELLYSGSDAEFVVLVNASTATVDLTGWTIGDEETPGAGEGFYTLPPGAQLSAGALLVIARDGAVFRATWGRSADAEFADTDATTPDLHRRRDLGGGQWALNDSGDEVILLNPSGEVADAVVFGDGDYGSLGATGALRAAKGFALQRVPGATYLDGSDQRHRFLYGPPQPFTSIQLPATTAPSALPVQSGWRIVWGSLGAQSNFSDGGTAPPHYLQAAAAAQGLNFLAIADPTLITPWQSASPLTALPAWQWQGEGGAAIVYNQQTQPAGDLETLLTQAEIGDTQIQWQDGTLPATGPLSALAADQISVPESLSTLYKQWRSAGTPLLPSGNANPPVPGALAPAPRYTGLVIEQSIADTDAAAALKRALAARRGWLTNTPGLWLTLAQQQNDGSLHWMGGTLAAQNEITLQISYGDRSGDLAGLAIWQDDRPLRQIDLPTANRTWEVTLPALPNTLLYAVATQADGGFAVTAPLYILPAQGGAVVLNEVLPAPWSDHNRDGQVNTDDEFIELYNPSPYPLSLDGWQLFDAGAEAGGRPYTFRSGAFINGRSWLVLYRSVSHVSLNNTNEVVSLRDPDGVEIDRITWVNNPGQGASRSRLPDGAGWQDGHATPGQANEPFSADRVEPWPTPIGSHGSQGSDQQQDDDDNNDPPPPIQLDPRHGQAGGPPASVAQSKLSGLDADVEFYAVVTAPPGLFNATIYVADPAPDPQAGPYAGIGINVYLRQAFYPTLQEGDRVRVRGVLKSFRGEMELQLADASAIQRVGTSTVLQPLPVTGAEIGETLEGRLVSLQGIVTGWQGDSIFLQDPANPTAEAVRVTVRSSTGWRRPYVNRGERWQVTGIVSQFAREAPWNGGYRILVRYPTDLVKAQ